MRILLVFILLFTKVYSFSTELSIKQKSDSLTIVDGLIKDSIGTPIEGVSVALLKASDLSIIKINLTNREGKFIFDNVSAGSYILKTSYIGYEVYNTNFTVPPNSQMVTLPLILLKATNFNLNTINVVARKKILELKTDRIIFNVENTITAPGETALEVLKKAPGVSVSSDESVALKGNRGVQILINGRLTQLSGGDLSSYLKSVSGGNIQTIEIISNPSAKFDASGTAGIINIKLKQNPDVGFNGNISGNLSVGKSAKTNEQADINYRSGKVNVFGNYGFNYDQNETLTSMNRVFNSLPGRRENFDQHTLEKEIKTTNSYKIGLDYQINPKNVFGAMFNGFSTKSADTINSQTDIGSVDNAIDSILLSNNFSKRERKNYNYNLNYRYSDTNGTAFNIDLNYIKFIRYDESLQPNSYIDPIGTQLNSFNIFYNQAPSDIRIRVGKIDFDKRIFLGNMSVGSKVSSVTSENDFRFYDVLDGTKVLNDDLTNLFSYEEDIIAGYFNLNDEFKNWTYQVGLRAEHTSSRGILTTAALQNSTSVKTNYLNFFPSAAISYKLNTSHVFSLAYSRRIQRPDYQSLNPFEFRIDELTYSRGNPFLKPQLSHSFQLTYSLGQYLIASLGYIKTSNVVALIIDSAGGKRIAYIPENVTAGTNINASLSTNLTLTNWWALNATANGYRASYKSRLPQFQLNNSGFTVLVSGQNNFKVNNIISAELSFFYRTSEVFGSFRNKGTGQVDIGMQAKVLKERGVLRVGYSDVFKTLYLKSRSDFNNINIRSVQNPESQIFKLGFSYKFGSSITKQSRSRRSGSEDENRRL